MNENQRLCEELVQAVKENAPELLKNFKFIYSSISPRVWLILALPPLSTLRGVVIFIIIIPVFLTLFKLVD